MSLIQKIYKSLQSPVCNIKNFSVASRSFPVNNNFAIFVIVAQTIMITHLVNTNRRCLCFSDNNSRRKELWEEDDD